MAEKTSFQQDLGPAPVAPARAVDQSGLIRGQGNADFIGVFSKAALAGASIYAAASEATPGDLHVEDLTERSANIATKANAVETEDAELNRALAAGLDQLRSGGASLEELERQKASLKVPDPNIDAAINMEVLRQTHGEEEIQKLRDNLHQLGVRRNQLGSENTSYQTEVMRRYIQDRTRFAGSPEGRMMVNDVYGQLSAPIKALSSADATEKSQREVVAKANAEFLDTANRLQISTTALLTQQRQVSALEVEKKLLEAGAIKGDNASGGFSSNANARVANTSAGLQVELNSILSRRAKGTETMSDSEVAATALLRLNQGLDKDESTTLDLYNNLSSKGVRSTLLRQGLEDAGKKRERFRSDMIQFINSYKSGSGSGHGGWLGRVAGDDERLVNLLTRNLPELQALVSDQWATDGFIRTYVEAAMDATKQGLQFMGSPTAKRQFEAYLDSNQNMSLAQKNYERGIFEASTRHPDGFYKIAQAMIDVAMFDPAEVLASKARFDAARDKSDDAQWKSYTTAYLDNPDNLKDPRNQTIAINIATDAISSGDELDLARRRGTPLFRMSGELQERMATALTHEFDKRFQGQQAPKELTLDIRARPLPKQNFGGAGFRMEPGEIAKGGGAFAERFNHFANGAYLVLGNERGSQLVQLWAQQAGLNAPAEEGPKVPTFNLDTMMAPAQ